MRYSDEGPRQEKQKSLTGRGGAGGELSPHEDGSAVPRCTVE